MRIVQLSDLHLQDVGHHEQRVAERVKELRPDLVLLTGDSIDRRDRLPQLAEFLSLLPAAKEALAILGNWEHWSGVDLRALRTTYARHGVQLLRNESVTLSFPAGRLLVTGLDDLVGGRPDLHTAVRDVAPQRNHLLLAHCPAQRDSLARHGGAAPFEGLQRTDPALLEPQLMLAGHTHGGQVRFGGWSPFRPQGSGRYVSGWYRGGDVDMYVSRGLGTSVLPARIGSPPEIAVFEWELHA